MRGFSSVILAGLLALIAEPACSQTTTFTSATCNSGIAISDGGLALRAINNLTNQMNCRANVGKYSGKWYFQEIPSVIGWSHGVGAANSGWNTTTSDDIGGSANSAGYMLTEAGTGTYIGRFGPNNQRATRSIPYVAGKTIAIAINMDRNPREMWITPDVTGNTGCGGGPVWNGSSTSAPVTAAPGTTGYPCGGAGTGQGTFGPGDTGETGMGFFLAAAYPAWTGQDFGSPASRVTFSFSDNPTLDAAISGYQPWNNSGGGPSIPGPLNPMVRNIANAPAWQQNTAYTAFPHDDRVVAGPAYNPSTGLYTNGQPLYLWAVAAGDGGTSGANSSYSSNFASCPSPANVGGTVAPGGYTSSGNSAWNAATHVTDGSVTWVCLTPVDYTTFTSANIDDVYSWAPSTPYFAFQFVRNGNNVYFLYPSSNGISPPSSITCTSGSVSPTGTVQSYPGNSDGNCGWIYQGIIGYSSQTSIWKHELMSYVWSGSSIAIVPQYNSRVINKLWWGGYAQQLYQDSQNGEADPIFATQHYGQPTDNSYTISCPGAAHLAPVACFDLTQEYTTASGDSFIDNMNPAIDPLRYDSTKGIALFSNTTFDSVSPSGGHPETVGSAFTFDGSGAIVDRLQMQATSGDALPMGSLGPGNYNVGGQWIHHNIIDSAGGYAGLSSGSACDYDNNVIIFRGTGIYFTPGYAVGTQAVYGGSVFDNTIIGPGASACPLCSGITVTKSANYGPIRPGPIYNNLIFGWGQEFGFWTGSSEDYITPPSTPPYNSGNNATDLPASYTGTSFTSPPTYYSGPLPVTTISYPGGDSMTCGPANNVSCRNLNATDVFVDPNPASPTFDLRLKPSSPVIGAGANFSYPVPFVNPLFTPGPDILGQSRKRRIDLGAIQAPSGAGGGSSGRLPRLFPHKNNPS